MPVQKYYMRISIRRVQIFKFNSILGKILKLDPRFFWNGIDGNKIIELLHTRQMIYF